MQINWYPGHMAKAKRLLIDQLMRVDVVVELCDARLPLSSRNPDLAQLTEGKQRVLLLNKADLAEARETQRWLAYFRAHEYRFCAAVNSQAKAGEALSLIDRAARDTVERAAARGIKKTVRAMVVGVPNVGKSTLINRLHGGAVAKVGDRPGVTRANQWVRVNDYLELLDTPGLLWPRLSDALAAKRLSYIGTIRDEVLDVYALALSLMTDLLAAAPDAVAERFKVKDTTLSGLALMEAVCKGRGFLLRGGEYDIDRACAVVLDEFRAGKLGRITLEKVEDDATEQAAKG